MQLRGFLQPRCIWFGERWSYCSIFGRFNPDEAWNCSNLKCVTHQTLTKPLYRCTDWILSIYLEASVIVLCFSFLTSNITESILYWFDFWWLRDDSTFSLSLAGAPLKVCPQGFSCCTVEMEEKLSQQSHTEIKAPVSRLSTNLQSTFKQRHDHFDSKQTHPTQTHTWTAATFQATLCRWLVSLQQHLCCMDFDRRSHLPVHCPERRHSVCVRWPVHLSLIVSAPCLIAPPPPTSLPPRETCTLPDGPHTFSDLVFSVLPVPLCVSTYVYACKYWDQVSLGAHGNMQQCWVTKELGQLWILSATAAALQERHLMR